MKAPVDTALDQALRTPGFGMGVHEREGGLKAGQKKWYDVTITRTSGPTGSLPHTLRLVNNEARTFSIVGPRVVKLPLNKPVTVRVQAAPRGAKSLQVTLAGLKEGSRTFFTAINPYGLTVADNDPDTKNVPGSAEPVPGVWEIAVDSRRKSALPDNPYKLNVSAFAASFDPAPVTVPEAKVGTPVDASWTLTNKMAAVDGTLEGGTLGSSKTARPTVANGVTQRSTIEVPEGTTSLNVTIGRVRQGRRPRPDGPRRPGKVVGQSAGPQSDESVAIVDRAAGTYTVEVVGFAVPSGSTTYDYRDVFFSSAVGDIAVDESAPVKLGTGDSTKLSVSVTAARAAAGGRELVGKVRLVNARGTTAGVGDVTIEKVTQ